jgi:glycosyltransferase involved in cell wall biosynthesis
MSDSLRVAIFAESYLPYLSGVTVATEALARTLGAAGHEVLLAAPRPAGDGEPGTAGARGPEPGYAWLPSYQPPPPAPAGYRMPSPLPGAALDIVRDFRPQVVHAQSPFVSGLMARRLAQKARLPLVFTHHTRFGDYGHYLGPLAGVGRRVVAAYLRDFWAGCAAIIAPGSELGDEIRAALGTAQRPLVRTIPSGVDLAAVRALPAVDLRAEHGWPADAVVAVSLGRIAPEKSAALLVRAFADAARADHRLRLLLIGGGPSADAMRQRAGRPDLAGRVAITGMLPRREALARLRGGDFFVFASRTETQGLVLCEALAAGLPVAALAGPGVSDSVRDGVDGLVVPRPEGVGEAAAALADAIRSLASDALLRGRLVEGAVAGAERFDVARRTGEVVDLYREIIARR